MAKKSKIQYGKANLSPEKIEPKDENVRISIVMEGDLLDAIKARASETGKPYQTLMKEVLRESIMGKAAQVDLKQTIRQIVREELKRGSAA